mgnify:CR=1 FL=1|jgi:hypothetical protein
MFGYNVKMLLSKTVQYPHPLDALGPVDFKFILSKNSYP